MKKVLFAMFLTVIGSTAFSQANINKGDWMLGGTAGFNSSKMKDVDESQTTTIHISPDAGYFFINQFAGGVRFQFTSEKVKGEDASTSVLAAPFLRYYFLPSTNKANVFLDASYCFGSVKYNPGTGSVTNDLNQFGVTGGLALFLNPATALEFGLGYTSAGGDAIGDKRVNNIGFNIGFQIHLSGGGGAAK
jgi:hypothetical protein